MDAKLQLSEQNPKGKLIFLRLLNEYTLIQMYKFSRIS